MKHTYHEDKLETNFGEFVCWKKPIKYENSKISQSECVLMCS